MNATAESKPATGLNEGFQIGDLRVDPQTGDLTGPQGREQLDPKVMGVLVMLAEHAGQVVSREDLLIRLWPDVVVTDDALSRCLYELRRQMSAAAGNDHCRTLIETLPKRGYRLKASITPILVPPAARPQRRITWLVMAGGALVAIAATAWIRWAGDAPADDGLTSGQARPSVAVLPFTDLSQDHDQGFFADGTAEEILNWLSQSKDLRVIGRTSSFALRDADLDVREIARRLDVTHVVEGSVRKSGDKLRVTAQLISGKDGSHVWSSNFDRELDDIFAIQEDIAAAVAAALKVNLGRERPAGTMPANYAAWERYRQAEFFYFRRAPGDLELARKYYEESVALAPRYARAWASLSGAYDELAWETDPVSEALQRKALAAAEKAVALEPGLAVAHARLAKYYYNFTGDFEQAGVHARRAAALDPNEPIVLIFATDDAIERGDLNEAIGYQRRIVARDPLMPLFRTNLAFTLLADGRLAEALSEFRKVLEINPDAGPDVDVEIVRILVLQGRFEEAVKASENLPADLYLDHAHALFDRIPGRAAAAEAALQRIIEYDAAAPDGSIRHSIRLADALAWRGRFDEAFAVLERRVASLRGGPQEKILVWYTQQRARISPFLKPMHLDPRWKAFLASR